MTYWKDGNQTEEKPMSNEAKVAIATFSAFTAGDFFLNFTNSGMNVSLIVPLLIRAVPVGMAAGAAIYGVLALVSYSVYLWIDWSNQTPKEPPPVVRKQPEVKPQEQTKQRVEFSVVTPAVVDLPDWKQHLESILFDDGRIRAGSRIVDIPNDVSLEHVEKLTQARWEGKLPFASSVAFSKVDISRDKKQPPNAQSLMMWLLGIGAIEPTGQQKPCKWTRIGERMFPAGDTTSLPSFIERYYDASRVTSGDAANAAAATAELY